MPKTLPLMNAYKRGSPLIYLGISDRSRPRLRAIIL